MMNAIRKNPLPRAVAASRLAAIRSRQRGQAFLLTLLILGILLAALAYRMVTPANITAQNDLKTEAALAQAREALLGYTSSQYTTNPKSIAIRPGRLPCPDTTGDGQAETNCTTGGSAATSARIGRLPWRTLGIADLRDGAGEQLWYAVSRNFAATTGTINSDTTAEYTVTGVSAASNVVAVIFAPGAVVGSQRRDAVIASCSTTGTSRARNLCAENYLEGGNQDGNASFVGALSADAYNDKLMVITHDMLFKRVLQRVANHARAVLNSYYQNNAAFPTASALGSASNQCAPAVYQGRVPLPPTSNAPPEPCAMINTWTGVNFEGWFSNNNWHHYLYYAVSPNCTNAAMAAACSAGGGLTVNSKSTSVRALLIATGRAYSVQNRPCATASDCLEDAENTNGDTVFTVPVASSTNNDQLIIVSP